MKKISEKIIENRDSFEILSKEIKDYTAKMSKVLPTDVQNVLYILNKYKIENKAVIEDIKSGKKSTFYNISNEYNIPLIELENLKKSLRDLKTNIKLLPQYQTKSEREQFILGKLAMNDLTLDLDSEKGRSAIAKQYAPLVFKIVQQFIGKSPLDKAELTSAGLEGLTYAMNTYRKSDNRDLDDDGKKAKQLSFKQYACWSIRNNILKDINDNAYTVSLGQYGYTKLKNTEEGLPTYKYIDKKRDLDVDYDVSYFPELFENDNNRFIKNNDEIDVEFEKVINILYDQFPKRNVIIFLKYFGLGNYQHLRGNQIAKEFHIQLSVVNQVVKEIINHLKQNSYTKELLYNIADLYNESLVVQLFQLEKQLIKEALLNDDIYLLLEDLTRWNNKQVFKTTIKNICSKFSVEEEFFILKCLEKGFDFLDSNYKKNKSLIIWFLSDLYPTENFSKKTDVAILELMNELIEFNNKHKISWDK